MDQKTNTWKYTITQRNTPFAVYDICKYWKGEKHSGGPMIAVFYDKDTAKEYVEFKNSQVNEE